MNRQIKYLIFLFLLGPLSVCYAQELSKLNSKKEQLINQIQQATDLLKKYDQSKLKNITQIKIYDRQIKDREALLNINRQELEIINLQIQQLDTQIKSSELELHALKKEYARLIQKAYANKKIYTKLSFFLGAQSFNEAYRKYILLNEYNKFRISQGRLIEKKSDLLKREFIKVDSIREQKKALLNKMELEKSQLSLARRRHQENVQVLSKKERKLKQNIKKHQKALQAIENNILRLIRESSKEKVAISNFHEVKGKLPWPVKKGLVISKFGEHKHPVLKYVKVSNNGVDIKVNQNLSVYSVFEGEVSRVIGIPGYNKAVIIRHGKYLTVYANLSSVFVKTGDIISTSKEIGRIYSGEGDNAGVLHFEVWEESKKLNPELWLAK